ncbi:MAG: hypothetical protein K2H09_07100 [Treponemataceae bacterium]|nr:hypothetical protein [Treponemataceae bacterium]
MEMLRYKMCMEKDDLKDTSMLMDYADEAKEKKDEAGAAYFYKRAKQRWEDYLNSHEEVRRSMEKLRGTDRDAPDSIQAEMLGMLLGERQEHAERLKRRIEQFAA